jgi:hypothetical protein
LLRQYFPKGTDLSRYAHTDLNMIALRLNQRPRNAGGYTAGRCCKHRLNLPRVFKMFRSSVTRANSRLSCASSAASSACRPEPGKAPPCVGTSFCHLYSRLRGMPSSRVISAAGRWLAFSSKTACRLHSGVNRRRRPISHLLRGNRATFEMSVKPGLAHPAPFMAILLVGYDRTGDFSEFRNWLTHTCNIISNIAQKS